MPEILVVLFGDSTLVQVIYYGTLALLGLLVLFLVYRKFAPGPRRRRGLRQVRASLASGNWADALKYLDNTRKIGLPSARWHQRFNLLEAEALVQAQAAALQGKKFDQALEHAERIADLREQPPQQSRLEILEAILAETRRLFSIPGESRAVLDLAARALEIHPSGREASFWQGMASLRGGQPEKAFESFLAARGEMGGEGAAAGTAHQAATPFIDPSLYLGAVLLRQGKAKDSLRFLTEANRMDTNCPVVTILLGSAVVEAGGDTNLAVKALQRALGPRGLQIWADQPQRAWVEAFPEGRSYVRKLASQHPFHCPLFGNDLKFLQLQGMLALGQGLYKLAEYQEAANYFTRLIQEGAPSLPVVRGVGLSLARIGKYDEAFRHLRAAHEMENPPERTTAGFLALCGAKGTPKSDEDRLRNLAWAIKTITPFTAPGDTEWVSLVSVIFAEARDAGLDIAEDDQLYLCEHLLSIHAADPGAAQAFLHLFATHPGAVRPEYAWLFAHAAQKHPVDEPHALNLFGLAFADRPGLEAFYRERGWSVAEAELAYLRQAAKRQPGRFPEPLGTAYPPRGEEFLRAMSLERERAGDLEGSLAIADILGKLAPDSTGAQDRVAGLFFRRGEIEEALGALERWQAAHPHDPLPLARAALIRHAQGDTPRALELLERARAKAQGPFRAKLAYLAAQLTLRQGSPEELPPEQLQQARRHLEACLEDVPDHDKALANLAALGWLLGEEAAVARLAPALDQPGREEAQGLFFAALARFAQGQFDRAATLCAQLRQEHPLVPVLVPSGGPSERNGTAADPAHIDWEVEGAFLQGLAEQALGRAEEASKSLACAAHAADSPSASHAQGLLGQVAFSLGDYEAAGRWWQNLEQRLRAAWKIGEALGGTVFLTALQSMEEGRFEEAADKLRTAGRLGCRDRRLGQLLHLALFRAGQKRVYGV